MRIRTGLFITSFVTLASSAAILACGGSTSSPIVDAQAPKSDGGSSTKDSGTKSDAPSKDTGTTSGSGSGSSPGSGSGSGPSDAGSPIDVGSATDADKTACNAAASAECTLIGMCNQPALLADYGDAGNCMGREYLSCVAAQLAPGTGANPMHTASCATAEGTESCTDDLNGNPPTACAQVTGPGATGSTCAHPGQCMSGFCAINPSSVCGTCQAAPAAGDSCLDLTTCGTGLVCSHGSCVAYGAAMATCGVGLPCGAGLDCVAPGDAGAGTCQASGATVGTACDPATKTAANCDIQLGLYCVSGASSANAKTCQQALLATAGQECGQHAGVKHICVASSCFTADGGESCVALAADKGACNTVTGPDCTPPSRCIGTQLDGGTSGTCTLPVSACP